MKVLIDKTFQRDIRKIYDKELNQKVKYALTILLQTGIILPWAIYYYLLIIYMPYMVQPY